MASYQCESGPLMVLVDGTYVPFLVQTLDNCIIWDEIGDSIKNAIVSSNLSSYELKIPESYYQCYYGNWDIKIYHNGKCEMEIDIPLTSSNGMSISQSGKLISGTISLPIKLSSTKCCAFSTINAGDDSLKYGISTVTKNVSNSKISTISINIMRIDQGSISSYSNSSISLKISGMLSV